MSSPWLGSGIGISMYHLGLVDRVDLLLPTSYIGGVTRNGEHRMTVVLSNMNENVC